MKEQRSSNYDPQLLKRFQVFCSRNSSPESQRKLRNILANSPSKEHSIKELIKREQHYELSDHEAADMLKLVTAFLDKQSSRKQIDVSVRKKLLLEQNGLCVMCGRRIGLQSHLDHKVPFVYVGDHLDDNFQMLCAHCNHAKGKKIDF